MPDTDTGRQELIEKLRKTQEELKHAYANLTATQARCTTLIQEVRAYARHAPLDAYQVSAVATSSHADRKDQDKERIIMACFGLAGETGETIDYLKKVFFHGHALDEVKLKKEIGDVLWYIAELCSAYEFSLQEIADMNIAKLQERYQGKFSEDKSRNRAEGT